MGPLETDKSGLPPPYPYVTATPVKQTNEPSTWEKWLIYGAAAIFGIIAIICGIFTIISLSIGPIFGGLILIISGLLVIALEAPILCSCVSFIEPIGNFSKARAPWQKIILYILPPIPVLILTQSIAAIFGSLFIFGVAFIYFYIFFRRR